VSERAGLYNEPLNVQSQPNHAEKRSLKVTQIPRDITKLTFLGDKGRARLQTVADEVHTTAIALHTEVSKRRLQWMDNVCHRNRQGIISMMDIWY